MNFKANYVRLSEISDSVIEKHDDFINELKDLLKIAEDIKTSWDGPDYETFNDNLIDYINSIIPITEDIKYIGDYIKKASKSYEESDLKWVKDIERLEKDEKIYEE